MVVTTATTGVLQAAGAGLFVFAVSNLLPPSKCAVGSVGIVRTLSDVPPNFFLVESGKSHACELLDASPAVNKKIKVHKATTMMQAAPYVFLRDLDRKGRESISGLRRIPRHRVAAHPSVLPGQLFIKSKCPRASAAFTGNCCGMGDSALATRHYLHGICWVIA